MKKNYRGLLAFVSLLIAFLFIGNATVTYGKEIVRNDHFIQSTDDPEIRIYVREKYNNTTDPKRAVKRSYSAMELHIPGTLLTVRLKDTRGWTMR